MAKAARTEDDVRSLRVLADRFDRFAEQLETAGGEGFRPGDDASFVLARRTPSINAGPWPDA